MSPDVPKARRRTRWLRPALGALLAAVGAVATRPAVAPVEPVERVEADAVEMLSTRFRVLRPDGTPAAGAEVLTNTLRKPADRWRTTTDAEGWATPGVPLDHPTIAAMLTPTSRLVSVFIEIYDGYAPGDDDGAFTFASAVLNAGDPDLPPATHFDGLEGTTLTLRAAKIPCITSPYRSGCLR